MSCLDEMDRIANQIEAQNTGRPSAVYPPDTMLHSERSMTRWTAPSPERQLEVVRATSQRSLSVDDDSPTPAVEQIRLERRLTTPPSPPSVALQSLQHTGSVPPNRPAADSRSPSQAVEQPLPAERPHPFLPRTVLPNSASCKEGKPEAKKSVTTKQPARQPDHIPKPRAKKAASKTAQSSTPAPHLRPVRGTAPVIEHYQEYRWRGRWFEVIGDEREAGWAEEVRFASGPARSGRDAGVPVLVLGPFAGE